MFEAAMIVGLIALYFFFMIFYPEWVGIMGKVGKRNEQARQKGSKAEDPDFLK